MCQRFYLGQVFIQGGAVAASTATTLYSYTTVPVIMRTTPTFTFDTATVIRGYGKNIGNGTISSISVAGVFDSQIRLLATLSSSSLITNQIYAFANGVGTLDAEIY